ncbi:MAG: DUF3822 family protein [Bacteroidales bacterium]|nr:DUF3822 family protein [Bacteroidales bacterium]
MGTRISFRYKNENKPETLDKYTKAIRFWEGGFCLAVYEPESRNVALMEEHLFEEDYPLNGKMHLLAETEAAWETGGGTRFICFNRPNTQIPEKLFNEADKKLYLELLTDNPYRFTPIEEPVAPFALYTLSGWDNNLYHEILSLHPDCRLQSGMSLLLQLLARQEGKRKMAAFVENGHLDVAAAERTALLGANSFPFQNSNDFLYCLAGFAHTLFGSTKEIQLYMGGEIEEGSLLFTSTRKYFPALHFLDSGFPIIQQEQHRYCDLLFQEA